MTHSLPSTIQLANVTLLSQGKHELVGEFFTSDYLVHLTDQDLRGGHKIVLGFLELYQRAFPDIRLEVEILVEGADRIAWQRTLHATHQGAFKGFPASGRKVVWRDVVTSRFRDGLIAEEWVISDLAEQMLLSRKKG